MQSSNHAVLQVHGVEDDIGQGETEGGSSHGGRWRVLVSLDNSKLIWGSIVALLKTVKLPVLSILSFFHIQSFTSDYDQST